MNNMNKDGIPLDTPYCYKPDYNKNEEAKRHGDYSNYYIIECKYYQHIDGLSGRCTKLNTEVLDQVKECKVE